MQYRRGYSGSINKRILIKNAKIVNEGTIVEGDVLIENELIVEIGKSIQTSALNLEIIDTKTKFEKLL